MNVKETAMKWYPKYWSKERVVNLVKLGRMTAEEYREVTGEEYAAE